MALRVWPPARRSELGQLTLDVERACYGEQPPDEAQVASIEQRAAEIDRGLKAPHEAAAAPESRASR